MKGVFTWFREVIGREPEPDEFVVAEVQPEQMLCIGRMSRIAYRPTGLDSEYIHTFNKRDRPLLYVALDGRTFLVAQGRYRFTERGFEDA